MALGSIANGTVVFPTYSESGFEQAGELVELFENDFFNHIGQDLGEEQGKLRYVQ